MKFHYGRSATLFYKWNGRGKHYSGRLGSMMAFYNRHKNNNSFEVRFISTNGMRFQPNEIEVTR